MGDSGEKLMFIRESSKIAIFKEKVISDYTDVKKQTPHVWGGEYGSPEYHVKVKFHKSVRNLVLSECAFTDTNKTVSEIKDDYFYFEGTIRGLDSFKKWLRSLMPYGILLEPENVREDMLKRIEETLENYKKI